MRNIWKSLQFVVALGVTVNIALSTAWAGSAETLSYTLTDLGPLGPNGQPINVTNNSLVSGDYQMGSVLHAVLWYRGQMTDIGQYGFGGQNSIAFDVNVRAQAVGQAETSVSDPYGEDFCGFGTHLECLPFIWQSGFMTPLPTLGGRSGSASQINSQGQIAGIAENATWDSSCAPPQQFQFKPVIWSGGKVQQLPTAAGDLVGIATSINETGQVVGASGPCTYSDIVSANIQPLHALLWENGSMTDLGNLGGTGKFFGNLAKSINNKGQVVGWSDLRGDTSTHAFLWEDGQINDLGTFPGDALSVAIAINDSGAVVGASISADLNNFRAVIWHDGVLSDLNDLIPADSPLQLAFGCSINAGGEIIGWAVDSTGEVHGYLLEPRNSTNSTGSISPALRDATHPKVLSEKARQQMQQRLPFGRFGALATGTR